jgi:ABC-type amino acid transport substrate-binding protein
MLRNAKNRIQKKSVAGLPCCSNQPEPEQMNFRGNPLSFRPFLMALLILAQAGFASEKLDILAEDDAGPWSLKNGTGFANDLVRAAFMAAGVEAHLQVVPYERAKQMVIKGEAVACFSMSWLPEYEGKILFSDKPLFTCQADYFHNLSKPLMAGGEEAITNTLRIGIVNGYEYPPSLKRLQTSGLAVLEDASSEVLNLKKLAAGRIDAAIINHNKTKSAEYIIASAEVTGKVGVVFPCGILKSYIGFSSKHPSGLWARDKFNAGFRTIESNGIIAKIEAEWAARSQQRILDMSSSSHGPGKKPPAHSPQPPQ